MAARLTDHVWSIAELLHESEHVGSEKWICQLHEPIVSAPVESIEKLATAKTRIHLLIRSKTPRADQRWEAGFGISPPWGQVRG